MARGKQMVTKKKDISSKVIKGGAESTVGEQMQLGKGDSWWEWPFYKTWH